MRRAPSRGIIGGEWCLFSVCVFSLFFHVGKQEEEHIHAPSCTSSTIAQVTTSKHKKRGVKRQLTITHVGERWIDSGGESWAELSALTMKRIESAQGKILVNGCS